MWPGMGGVEAVRALEAAGVHRAVIPAQVFGADPAAGMRKLSEEVIAKS